MSRGPALAGVAAAVLTIGALTVVALRPIEIATGTAAWGRIVRGPTADGILYPGARAIIALPDLPRARPREVVIDGVALGESLSVLSVSVDGAPPVVAVLDARRSARVAIPAAAHVGVRLDLAAERGASPARLQAVRVGGAWPSLLVLLAVSVLAGLATWGAARVERLDARVAIALAPVTAAAAVLAFALATGALSVGWSGAAILAAALLAAGILAGRACRVHPAPLFRAPRCWWRRSPLAPARAGCSRRRLGPGTRLTGVRSPRARSPTG